VQKATDGLMMVEGNGGGWRRISASQQLEGSLGAPVEARPLYSPQAVSKGRVRTYIKPMLDISLIRLDFSRSISMGMRCFGDTHLVGRGT